jgi:ribosome-associated protein
LPQRIVFTDELGIDASELQFSFSRSPGPGGQNVNKVNTKATLHWSILASAGLPWPVKNRLMALYAKRMNDQGELVISSSRYRSQGQNVEDCIDKLRAMVVAAATPPKVRRPTRPPRAAKVARETSKRRQSEKKSRRRPPEVDDA